jgi:hypothetical protein
MGRADSDGIAFDAEQGPGRRRRGDSGRSRYLIEETGGLPEEGELKLSRILNAPPVPYTEERFDDNYNWTKDWGLVPEDAKFENPVDNRAWQ